MHRTVRCATGLCPVHQGLPAKLLTFGKTQRRSAIIHRTVWCTTGQCPVPQGRATLNSPASGIRSAIIHWSVSGAHRTVRCASGATTTSRATVDCNRIQCATVRAEVRARAGGAPDSLQDLSGAPPDSVRCTREPNSELLTFRNSGSRSAIIHRTVWCSTGLSSAPAE